MNESERLQRYRRERDEFFGSDPRSPIEQWEEFRGLAYFAEDPSLRFEARLERERAGETVWLASSSGEPQEYVRLGKVRLDFAAGARELVLFAPRGREDRLFLPFADATSGAETYGAGRYLEPEWLGSESVRIDFNYAYHPFCAYSDRYVCPFPPPDNRLDLPIRAGERLPEEQR